MESMVVGFLVLLVILLQCLIVSRSSQIIVPEPREECCEDGVADTYDPYSPLVNCSFLPEEFITCDIDDKKLDLGGNESAREELGLGCHRWGGQRYEEVLKTKVNCTVLPGIECYGSRNFLKEGYPCIKYNGHYFVTTLIYSVLLGFLGMDRFCLGLTGTAVGKLLTLGGVGIWWIVDVILLVTGKLTPQDGSNWVPYY